MLLYACGARGECASTRSMCRAQESLFGPVLHIPSAEARSPQARRCASYSDLPPLLMSGEGVQFRAHHRGVRWLSRVTRAICHGRLTHRDRLTRDAGAARGWTIMNVACSHCGFVLDVEPPSLSAATCPSCDTRIAPAERPWLLRGGDGVVTVFEGASVLQTWIEDGTVTPHHELSRDGNHWKPLHSIEKVARLFRRNTVAPPPLDDASLTHTPSLAPRNASAPSTKPRQELPNPAPPAAAPSPPSSDGMAATPQVANPRIAATPPPSASTDAMKPSAAFNVPSASRAQSAAPTKASPSVASAALPATPPATVSKPESAPVRATTNAAPPPRSLPAPAVDVPTHAQPRRLSLWGWCSARHACAGRRHRAAEQLVRRETLRGRRTRICTESRCGSRPCFHGGIHGSGRAHDPRTVATCSATEPDTARDRTQRIARAGARTTDVHGAHARGSEL